LTGCSHIHYLDPSNPGTNRKAAELLESGREATIRLSGNREVTCRDIRMQSDSTRWKDAGSGEVRSAATREVTGIVITDRKKGAERGFWTGALLGALAGYTIIGPELGGEEFSHLGRRVGAVGGAFFGGVMGMGIGRSLGVRHQILLQSSASFPLHR
jgi:hypothetical protein